MGWISLNRGIINTLGNEMRNERKQNYKMQNYEIPGNKIVGNKIISNETILADFE